MNFILGFHSLKYVDWRYKMLKEKTGKFYQVVNLLGICMFPTLVVYAATLPVIAYASITTFSMLDVIGLSIIVLYEIPPNFAFICNRILLHMDIIPLTFNEVVLTT